jgi:hypothetical protein
MFQRIRNIEDKTTTMTTCTHTFFKEFQKGNRYVLTCPEVTLFSDESGKAIFNF